MNIEALVVFVIALFALPLGMLVAEFGWRETFARLKFVILKEERRG